MIRAQGELERAAGLGAVVGRRPGGRWGQGARVRVVLAGGVVAALLAWSALGDLAVDASTDAPATTSAREAPRYEGRDKWTGHTSEWRSRPQILRDAGITQAR